jgi:hypothetical protein
MTKAGIKTEDYREMTRYWYNRLVEEGYCQLEPFQVLGVFKVKEFKTTTLTLGYPKSTDSERILKLEHKGIEIRTGNPEWGAEPNKLYFVILHGNELH